MKRGSCEYASDAAMGSRGVWAAFARGGSGDRLARAERASAAPMPATRAALDERTERSNVNTVLIHESSTEEQHYACAGIAAVIALTAKSWAKAYADATEKPASASYGA